MENPKCEVCINKITVLGSVKNAAISCIVCPFCNHKNKIEKPFKSFFISSLLGLFLGMSFSIFFNGGTFSALPTLVLAFIFLYLFKKMWPNIIKKSS